MAEMAPRWATISRPRRNSWKGSITPLRANSERLGRSSVPMSMSRKGLGTSRLTTRIISSGVTPLAAIEATKAPALVPT
jgi:hypothetical protein